MPCAMILVSDIRGPELEQVNFLPFVSLLMISHIDFGDGRNLGTSSQKVRIPPMKIYPRLQANTTLLARDAPNLIAQGESNFYINLALPSSLCFDSSALNSPHQQLSST